MKFDASPETQFISAVYSLLLGFLLGILYNIFKIPLYILIKLTAGNKHYERFVNIMIIINDIISSCIFAVVTVIFIYAANDGMIRYFMLVFELSGTVISRFTAGKLIRKLSSKIADITYGIIIFTVKSVKKLFKPIIAYKRAKDAERHILRTINNS
jgi:hypothetical protein